MNLARSSLKLFFANTGRAAISFLGLTYFARTLGASEIGIFFLFQALLGILAIPADFGLRGAVEKRISEGKTPGAFLSGAILLKGISISVIVCTILLLRAPINSYLSAEVAVWLAAAIILQEAAQLTVFVLKGELRVGETAVLHLSQQVIWFGLGAVLVKLGFEAEAMIFSFLAGLIVMLIWGSYKCSVKLRRTSLSHVRSLIDYSRYNVISSIGGYFYSWMDIAIIGLFLTQAHVGAYEVAWRVTAVSILFSQAISTTIFPQVSEWSANQSEERIEDLIATVMTPSLIFVIPAFFGSILMSREILILVFGSEYTIATTVMILLMGDKVFQALQVIVGKSLQAIDRPDLAAKATVVSVVVNGVLNVVLVLEFGIIGAAIATVASSLLNDFLHLAYLRKFISIQFPYREILECFGASLVMSGVLFVLKNTYEITNIGLLILFILIGCNVYLLTVLMMPNLRSRAKEMYIRTV